MYLLNSTLIALNSRQQIKYTLWAEQVYRSCSENDPTNSDVAAKRYKMLGLINIELVIEPSLCREIIKQMYELYDKVVGAEEKAKLRYESIIQLDSRRAYNEF